MRDGTRSLVTTSHLRPGENAFVAELTYQADPDTLRYLTYQTVEFLNIVLTFTDNSGQKHGPEL